ncbi:MAG: ATP-dependent DNA helicase, partial [Patescibacteria group bacterium]
PTAKLIVLKENYRSTQTILDLAHSLIQADSALGAETRVKLLAKNKIVKNVTKVKLLAFPKLELEINYLVSEVKEQLKNKNESVAIIYRDNADARPLVSALERAGLPFTLYAEESLFADRDIAKLLTLLRAINDFGSEVYLATSLQLDFIGLPLNIIYELFREARENKKTVFQVLAVSTEKKLIKFYKNYSAWHALAQNATLTNIFEVIIKESGFVNDLLKKPEVADKLNKLRGLFDLIKNLSDQHHEARLAELVEYLDLAIQHKLKIGEASPISGGGAQLLTAHKAKGLEFDNVYIMKARDGHFGNRRQRSFSIPIRGLALDNNPDADNADERRLFYVALTRAKKSVTITYSITGEAGQHYLPTQFIEEMDKDLLELASPASLASKALDYDFLKPRIYAGPKFSDKEYLKNLFLNQGLSVTALNNYLDCPWKYFFQNMLRMPAAKTRYLIYGTAVHAGLAKFFNEFKNSGKFDKKLLFKTFESALKSEPLTPSDFKILKEKGEKSLTGYFKLYHQVWSRPLYNEFQVKGIKLTPEIKLKGVIDKIEAMADGSVKVVDYKTGKPKPRSDQNYFRQLVFYKILLEKFPGHNFKVNSGTLDYLEPNDSRLGRDGRGIYKKEEFELTTEDTKKLIEQIKNVSSEIIGLKFWSKKCGHSDCAFCHLRSAMKN